MKKSDFEITEEETPKGTKFTIKGQVSSDSADELQEKLQNALKSGQKNLILNMMWVKFLSSSGIRVILKVFQDAKKSGGRLVIELPSKNVKNVLGMAALDEMLIMNDN